MKYVNASRKMSIKPELVMEILYNDIYPTSVEWVFVFLYIVTFLLGTIGNLLVVISYAKFDKLRNTVYTLILNLAISDLIVIFTCMPTTILGDITETWFLGKDMCKIFGFIQGISVSVSIFTLVCISVERYFGICRSTKSAKTHLNSCYKSLAFVWLLAIIVNSPNLFILSTKSPFEDFTILFTTCYETWSPKKQLIYQSILMVIIFVVPFFCMLFFYIQISLKMKSSLNERNKTLYANNYTHAKTKNNSSRRNKSRKRVAHMLVVINILFFVLCLPVYLLNIARYSKILNETSELVVYMALTAHWFVGLNSAINPIIYCLMSAKFRSAFGSICHINVLIPNSNTILKKLSTTSTMHRNNLI
ncbi:rhodopsin [Intoshia linei]|uniref:Rhodopsin n=1 Tax=Intoshia linei TaxID=1819745 RepID=A0A177B9B5_9BILA|nr:rhodopsin [Intoshia linei]